MCARTKGLPRRLNVAAHSFASRGRKGVRKFSGRRGEIHGLPPDDRLSVEPARQSPQRPGHPVPRARCARPILLIFGYDGYDGERNLILVRFDQASVRTGMGGERKRILADLDQAFGSGRCTSTAVTTGRSSRSIGRISGHNARSQPQRLPVPTTAKIVRLTPRQSASVASAVPVAPGVRPSARTACLTMRWMSSKIPRHRVRPRRRR